MAPLLHKNESEEKNMMKVIETGKIEKTEENKRFYNRKGYTMTGETLTIESNPYESVGGLPTCTEYVVFRHRPRLWKLLHLRRTFKLHTD